ncbi:hypothetical protein [Lysobacter sp. Root667]|uniref:hypothetical protein n=1 Tax=Lysobacter sp. Root667 TaxID=1736581 RepID=UPI0012DE2444|nr:hypothetical protein [Lysobacter sp. Root667]
MHLHRLAARCAFLAILAICISVSPAPAETKRDMQAAKPAAAVTALDFNGTRYLHRWSAKNQHEFTPPEQQDLSRWQQMLTFITHPQLSDDADVRKLAEVSRDFYKSIGGGILKTASTAPTPDRATEYLVAAMLPGKDFTEVVFTRIAAHDGGALVTILAQRHYGEGHAQAAAMWLKANGETAERELMAWTGLPGLKQLQALPQAK